jgi:hypothetical protein
MLLFSKMDKIGLRTLLHAEEEPQGVALGGRGPSPGRGGFGRGLGGKNRGSFHNNYGGHQKYNNDLLCQVCFKKNHTVAECWHRFDESYVPEQKSVALAGANAYNIDTDWYADSEATDHITNELEKLAIRNKY